MCLPLLQHRVLPQKTFGLLAGWEIAEPHMFHRSRLALPVLNGPGCWNSTTVRPAIASFRPNRRVVTLDSGAASSTMTGQSLIIRTGHLTRSRCPAITGRLPLSSNASGSSPPNTGIACFGSRCVLDVAAPLQLAARQRRPRSLYRDEVERLQCIERTLSLHHKRYGSAVAPEGRNEGGLRAPYSVRRMASPPSPPPPL